MLAEGERQISALLLDAFSVRYQYRSLPGDARWAILFVAVGDCTQISEHKLRKFCHKLWQNFQVITLMLNTLFRLKICAASCCTNVPQLVGHFLSHFFRFARRSSIRATSANGSVYCRYSANKNFSRSKSLLNAALP